MIIRQAPTRCRAKHKHRQQQGTDNHILLAGHFPNVLHRTPGIPAINTQKEYEIIDQRVGNSGLDLRHHRAGGLAVRILRPWPAVLLDHAHELHVAGHDGGDRGDEAGAQHEVAQPGDVEEGRGVCEARCEEGGFQDRRGEAVEDVETPAEGQEGDWEVHEGGVDRFSGCVSYVSNCAGEDRLRTRSSFLALARRLCGRTLLGVGFGRPYWVKTGI